MDFSIFSTKVCEKTESVLRQIFCPLTEILSLESFMRFPDRTIVVILHTSFQCLGTPAERYSERVSFIGRSHLLCHLDYGRIPTYCSANQR